MGKPGLTFGHFGSEVLLPAMCHSLCNGFHYDNENVICESHCSMCGTILITIPVCTPVELGKVRVLALLECSVLWQSELRSSHVVGILFLALPGFPTQRSKFLSQSL
jgi:hypothetical protein